MDLNKIEILNSLKDFDAKSMRLLPKVNTVMKFIEAKDEEPYLAEFQLCKK